MALPAMLTLGVVAVAWSKHYQQTNNPLKQDTKVYQPQQVVFGDNHVDYERTGNPKHFNIAGKKVKKLGRPTHGIKQDAQLINPALHNKEYIFRNTKRGMQQLNFARQLATPTIDLLDEWHIGQFSHAGSGPIIRWNPSIELTLKEEGGCVSENTQAV